MKRPVDPESVQALLPNLIASIPANDSSMLALHIRLMHGVQEVAHDKAGMSAYFRPTDGMFVLLGDRTEGYFHFRKKHILVHSLKGTRLYSKGDGLFGGDARVEGSWDRMWRLDHLESIEPLIDLFKSLPAKKLKETEYQSRHIPSWVKNHVMERDRNRCVWCGSNKDLHYDHDLPFSRGGSNAPENIRLLCQACNLAKGAKII